MKKAKFLIVITLILLSGYGYSQSPLPVGKTQLNFGVGISGWGVPVYVGLDLSVHRDITIGGEFSYRSFRENWKHEYYNHNVLGFSFNANYHFNSLFKMSQKWDVYAGLNVGFFVWASPLYYDGNHRSGLGVAGQIGARYYMTKRLALNLEFGGGNAFSGGKFGLSIKL
ncbi:MAG: hypothetical protein CVU02_02465 [Bacteroidetes bacterium HGW-Bacteroidetes-19]|nr:MAG: hypothetical protein CVU02_02465 [Bacteroidetes bacterium HGW-Bacteroidetes-19]